MNPTRLAYVIKKLLDGEKERGPFALLSLWNETGSRRRGGTSEMIEMAKVLAEDLWIINPENI